ncbi:helix-turn-helix domain-containing protein [Nocardia salmonicida]|uniref:helix-turn-helix domain-containing protein n=1 Tax=Nocardia salmonicida TaxID=53431 RepID=UPI0033F055FC
MTTKEAAEHTRYSIKTIMRAAQAGDLRGHQGRTGGPWRFQDWEVDKWLKKR